MIHPKVTFFKLLDRIRLMPALKIAAPKALGSAARRGGLLLLPQPACWRRSRRKSCDQNSREEGWRRAAALQKRFAPEASEPIHIRYWAGWIQASTADLPGSGLESAKLLGG